MKTKLKVDGLPTRHARHAFSNKRKGHPKMKTRKPRVKRTRLESAYYRMVKAQIQRDKKLAVIQSKEQGVLAAKASLRVKQENFDRAHEKFMRLLMKRADK